MAIQTLDLAKSSSVRIDGLNQDGEPGPSRFRIVGLLRFALVGMVVAQLGRIPVLSAGSKDAPILLNDLLVLLVVAAGLIAALRIRNVRVDLPAGLALLFAAVGGVSALLAIPRFGLSPIDFIFSIAYLLRWLAYFAIYVVTINFVRLQDTASVWQALETAILVFCLFGVVQSLLLPDFAMLVDPDALAYKDWDPQGNRLVSTFLDPNFAGAFINIALLMGVARMAYGLSVPKWKLFLLFAALLLTVSRGAVLAFLVGALLILAGRGVSKGMLRFIALATVLVVPALPLALQYAITYNKLSFDASAMTRVFAWVKGAEVFSRHPIIGVGFNTYGFVQAKIFGGELYRASFGLDGGLLFVAVLTGLVGLTVYCAMYAAVFARCRGIWRDSGRTPYERSVGLGVAAVTVSMLVQSFFLNTLFYPFLMEALWVLWGIVYLVSRERRFADSQIGVL